ncbi:MAG: DUF2961 domain-containing protein [Acidobacteriota bacterium]|nr:DUF2961 domain-containing protein [Acidobacteriota bacterium]
MKNRILLLAVVVAVMVVAPNVPASAVEPAFKPHPAYRLLDRLLRAPAGLTVRQDSSHNKQGINGDANMPLYKDAAGDDVIFDSVGPGCIRSLWGTAFDPQAVLRFYFDGEAKPRWEINEIEFFKGKLPGFMAPLTSYAKRGLWGGEPFAGNSFAPIPFEKSLKISIHGGESRFFHVISERYASLASAGRLDVQADRDAVEDAFARPGERPFEEDGLRAYAAETKEEIEAGEKLSLLKIESDSGIVREIEIEADGSEAFFRLTHLRLRWDGHVRWDAVVPVGIFFGSPNGANEMRSLPLRMEKLPDGRVRLRSYFPMAFWTKAEIEWINDSPERFGRVKARVLVGANDIPREQGTSFGAVYREGQTTYGGDWLFYEGLGTGWFAGVVQSMHEMHYCEGNERFTVDGAISPQINGTGSEDYYLACFWPNPDFDAPFGCVIGNIMEEGGGSYPGAYRIPSGYSRFHLEAPIPFYSSMRAVIQHGGMSDIRSQYRSLAFVYVRRGRALVKTDAIVIGSAESERQHGYRSAPSAPVSMLAASPEGENFEAVITTAGRIHAGGTISFRVVVDPANSGIRLRRRIDQKYRGQAARVFVDGRLAGVWKHGYENEFLRWFDADFDIAPSLTRGRDHLDVKLVLEPGPGGERFTEFGYEVFCFEK